ncbi:MAG: phosphoribosylanthranilate isomerase [Lachnospiraceae bacterium]|nr:phosphoribosylanthranilate isomerase [Lachnospiraceae bacterium]
MSKIKICGLKRPEDIAYVNRYLPDYVGFVFAKSPRQVTGEQAAELKKILRPEILSVGVFVNEEIDTIVTLVKEGIIDLIQLHGDESIEYVRQLQERLEDQSEGKVIRAIRVSSPKDVKAVLDYPTDYLLFDTYIKGQYGGSGETFNWQLLKEVNRPFFLAGGLTTENIRQALDTVNPFCLDVSSGAETNRVKDEAKIQHLVEMVRE